MFGIELTTTDVWTLVAIVVLIVALAFLAMAETALNRISKVKAQAMADATGSRSTRALAALASQPERFLNALLVTVTICQTAQAFLTSILAARLFGTVGVIVAFILNVIVFFVLAEAVPKTYAVLHPERAALISTPITAALVRFPPLQLISRALIGLTNVILPGKGLKQGPFVSEQELLGIVEAAAEDEVIEREERELIESIIEFGDTVAREVMVPRPDMVLIPHDATVSGALDIAIEHGFSRLPVMGAGEDEVVGLGHAKDLMRAERDGRGDEPAASVARPVRFVPENKPLNRLMREMQAEKFHMTIVLDEYGDIAGMVTLEDCLEELVGEIVDEFDREDREVLHLPDGTYVVDGGMSIGDLNDLLEIELPDEDWDTIAGFVFSTLGHVPVKGEAVVSNGWHFAAEQLDGHRIRRVRVSVAPGRHAADDSRTPAPDDRGASETPVRGDERAAGAPGDAAATG